MGEMKKKEKRISIGMGIIGIVLMCVIVSILINVIFIIPNAKKAVTTATENNMLDLASSSSSLVDLQAEIIGLENLNATELGDILGDVGIEGVDSSYAYVVDTDGIFVYHPKEEKIGTEVYNEVINKLLEEIPTGSYEPLLVAHYIDENGVVKYASYQVSSTTKWITVIVANEEDIVAPINTLAWQSTLFTLGAGMLLIILGVLIAITIIKPIRELTVIISRTAELDFSSSKILDKLMRRKDETGEMSRATAKMQQSLQIMVQSLMQISSNLEQNAGSLKSVTETINLVSTDNSATTEELAASMQETAATVETIDVNTSHIKENADQINEKAVGGLELSEQISGRADELHKNAVASNEETTRMYQEVKNKTEEAIEKSKAVEKVNALATTIQEIASQTSLLSLNASIEAARAGELGKGFAVVAGEIGNLANQSTSTANGIMDIIAEVNDAVANMNQCMNMALEFLESKVMKDYMSFIEVSNQYDSDAKEVNHSMNEIYTMAQELQQATEEIANAVSGITTTVGEAAEGVSDIAGKTTEVVGLSENVVEVVGTTSEYSDDLEVMANSFKL